MGSSVTGFFTLQLLSLWSPRGKIISRLSSNCHRVERSYRHGDHKHRLRSHESRQRQCEEEGSGVYPIRRSPLQKLLCLRTNSVNFFNLRILTRPFFLKSVYKTLSSRVLFWVAFLLISVYFYVKR